MALVLCCGKFLPCLRKWENIASRRAGLAVQDFLGCGFSPPASSLFHDQQVPDDNAEHAEGVGLQHGQAAPLVEGGDEVSQRSREGAQQSDQHGQRAGAGKAEGENFPLENQDDAGQTRQGTGDHVQADRLVQEKGRAENIPDQYGREDYRHQTAGQMDFRQVDQPVVEAEEKHTLQGQVEMVFDPVAEVFLSQGRVQQQQAGRQRKAEDDGNQGVCAAELEFDGQPGGAPY